METQATDQAEHDRQIEELNATIQQLRLKINKLQEDNNLLEQKVRDANSTVEHLQSEFCKATQKQLLLQNQLDQ